MKTNKTHLHAVYPKALTSACSLTLGSRLFSFPLSWEEMGPGKSGKSPMAHSPSAHSRGSAWSRLATLVIVAHLAVVVFLNSAAPAAQ